MVSSGSVFKGPKRTISGIRDFNILEAAIFEKPVQVTVLGAAGDEDLNILAEPFFRLLARPSDRPEVQAGASIEKVPGFPLDIRMG